MGVPPYVRQHFAQKHIEDAARYVAAIEENRFKEVQEDRRVYERFYNNLALFSGGSIALSITYLGYLKTLSRPVVHLILLKASWIALFLCLLSSLVYVICILYYGHYYRDREHAEALKKKLETEAREIRHMGITNLQTQEELTAYINPRQQAALKREEDAEWNRKRENRYLHLWVWAGRIARLGFVVGLGLLLAFAVSNT